jgi:DNA-binding transcriptional LysR family regulator
VLVISTPPGFTSKWLAPRLYRFSIAYPEIDVRVSSSMNNANFTTDGIDAAIRNLGVDAAHDEALERVNSEACAQIASKEQRSCSAPRHHLRHARIRMAGVLSRSI